MSINYVQKTSSCTISENGQTKTAVVLTTATISTEYLTTTEKTAVVLTTATISTEYQTKTEKQLNIMAKSGA